MSSNLPANKILLVDNGRESAPLLRQQLERAGFEVKTAVDGKTGLELARKIEPDLILLALPIPEIIQGRIFQLLKSDVIMKCIPVMILSDIDNAETRVHLLDLGADDYITSPFNGSELISRAAAILRRTGSHAGKERFAAKLIDHLIRKFKRRRYSIFSSLISSYSNTPPNWNGPIPDLLAEKKNKRIAICLAKEETLLTNKTRERWQVFLTNPGTSLLIVVNSRLSKRVARMLIKEYGLKCKVVLETEKRELNKLFKPDFNLRRYLPYSWLSIGTLCVVTAFLLTIFIQLFPSMIGSFVQGFIYNLAFHQPKDSERAAFQLEEIPNEWQDQFSDKIKKHFKRK